LKLRLGHSHDLIYNLPKHVNFYCSSVKRSIYVIVSLYEDMIKRVAYDLRSFRAPDVYKGKGIRYKDEKLRRKEGKKNNA
jgi:large subunit ribosomal protein L6